MQETVGDTLPEEPGDDEDDEPAPDPADDVQFPADWEYEPGETACVCVAGEAREYDQHFLLQFNITPSRASANIDQVNALADEDGELMAPIDLEALPYEVLEDLEEIKEETPASEMKDSQNLVTKCEQSLNQTETLARLGEALTEDDLELFKDELRDMFNEDIFPGSQVDVTIKIGSQLSPETTIDPVETASEGEGSGEDHADDEAAPKFLTISPEVNPAKGVPIRELSAGDEIEIRVVGPSVHDLRDEFLPEDDRDDAPLRSRPLFSKLLKVEPTGTGDESEIVVKITDDVFGKGSVDSNTMVELRRDEDIPSHIQLRRRILKVAVTVLIVVFSASLLILLFPGTFLDLISYL